MTPPQVALVLSAVTLSAVAQLLLKNGMYRAQRVATTRKALAIGAARSPLVLGGLATFGVASVLWIAALAEVPLSVAYPFTALSFLIILGVSSRAAHEHVTTHRWIGAGVVLTGLMIVVSS